MKNKTIVKKCLILSFALTGAIAFADNDVHTGELSGAYLGESHIDSVWENTYVKDGETVIFSKQGFQTDYTRANFTGANLTSACFEEATLTDVNFTNANLSSANLTYARLTDVDFTDATIKGTSFFLTGFAERQLQSTKSYKEKDLSGINLGGKDLSGWNFNGQNLSSASFSQATLTGADFTDATIKGADFSDTVYVGEGFTEAMLKSTKSYKEKDLSGINLGFNNLSGWNFNGQNLSSASFSQAKLIGADFTDATIKGANFVDAVSEGFTEAMLKSTKSYKEGDLSHINFSDNDFSDWDFTGQSLQNANLTRTVVYDTNLTAADLRGAKLVIYGTPIYKNTILADGVIKNFEMASAADSLTIRKYTPATSGGEMISAKISESDATVSGGATLKLDTGARLDVVNKKTLTIAENGVLIIDTSISDPTQIFVESLAGLVIDGKLTINITEDLLPNVEYKFDLISFEDGSIIDILEECISLTVFGESFDGVWSCVKNDNTFSIIATQVPEPATIAAIFGALALGLAIYRRRK